MRLIDADNYKGKVIASHCYSGVIKVIRIDDVPTVDVNNLIIEELEYIKAEIRYNGLYNEQIECLLDKHISELKGENNA